MSLINFGKTVAATGGKFRKVLLGLGGLAIAGAALSSTPAMAHDYDRHDRVEVRDRVIIERDHCRVWIPARYGFRIRFDCGRKIVERVVIEPGHFVIR